MTGFNSKHRGFSLLIALLLSTVAAAITVSLTTLAYKSLLLSLSARDSQYAFYAADAALECALYFDSSNGGHKFVGSSFSAKCGGSTANVPVPVVDGNQAIYTSDWFAANGTSCARFTLYKGDSTAPGTKIYADGTNVACSDLSNPRAVERGIKSTY